MISSEDLLRINDDVAFEQRARELASSGRQGEAVLIEAFAKARGTKPYVLIWALASASPGGEGEQFLLFLIATDKDKRDMALASLADIQKEAATPMLADIVASHPSWAMRDTALHCIALRGDRRGRQVVFDYFSRVLARKTRRDSIPPLVSIACSYLLRTSDGQAEVQQVAQLLSKRLANLTPLDSRWINEFWPGEWITQVAAQAPAPDVEKMTAFLVDPALQRRYHDLY